MIAGYPPTVVTVTLHSEGRGTLDGSPLQARFPFLRVVSTVPGRTVLSGLVPSQAKSDDLFKALETINDSSPDVMAGIVTEFEPRYVRYIQTVILPYLAELPRTPIRCTKDVRQCPDGSFVARQGPDCSFPPCPPVRGYGYGGYGYGESDETVIGTTPGAILQPPVVAPGPVPPPAIPVVPPPSRGYGY